MHEWSWSGCGLSAARAHERAVEAPHRGGTLRIKSQRAQRSGHSQDPPCFLGASCPRVQRACANGSMTSMSAAPTTSSKPRRPRPNRQEGEHPEHRPNYKAPAARPGPPQGAAAVARHRTQVQLLSHQLHLLHHAAPARWTETALAQHFDLPLGIVQACMCSVYVEGVRAYCFIFDAPMG